MERLTNSIDFCQMHCDFGRAGGCFFEDKSHCYDNNIYNRLREYEIAEEQGLLLRLPCKVGDTVWCIFEGKVYKGKAERFAYWHDTIDGDYVNIDVTYNIIDPFYTDGRLMRRCDPKRYGNRVFLTKEEAEKALKQMGE